MTSQIDSCLQKLRTHHETVGYERSNAERCASIAGKFLKFLDKHKITVDTARPEHVQGYIEQARRAYGRRHGRRPNNEKEWRYSQTTGINRLLCLVRGQWPPQPEPAGPLERFHWQLCSEYARWLSEARGLAFETTSDHRVEAARFLNWFGERASIPALAQLCITDIDSFFEVRLAGLRRTTRKRVALCVRSFLRYLHGRRLLVQDLSTAVVVPRVYSFEAIPSTLCSSDIEAGLKAAKEDRTAQGLRDFAILMLLSTYGLRAGEVTALRLEDIDWRWERLRIRHSKLKHETLLPLVQPVAKALLDYLQKGRPKVSMREIFVSARAPFRPFRSGSSLYYVSVHRLQKAGVQFQGKHGPHAFRHALAVNLLRASVPTKIIGDVLGHRSTRSTAAYLKLATDDLRSVALELPEVNQ